VRGADLSSTRQLFHYASAPYCALIDPNCAVDNSALIIDANRAVNNGTATGGSGWRPPVASQLRPKVIFSDKCDVFNAARVVVLLMAFAIILAMILAGMGVRTSTERSRSVPLGAIAYWLMLAGRCAIRTHAHMSVHASKALS
jgi:hypothetical protein